MPFSGETSLPISIRPRRRHDRRFNNPDSKGEEGFPSSPIPTRAAGAQSFPPSMLNSHHRRAGLGAGGAAGQNRFSPSGSPWSPPRTSASAHKPRCCRAGRARCPARCAGPQQCEAFRRARQRPGADPGHPRPWHPYRRYRRPERWAPTRISAPCKP